MQEVSVPVSIPEELPLVPLREVAVFPYMVVPLFVARARSIAALDDAMAGNRLLCLVTQRENEIEDPGPADLYRVGTVVTVLRTLHMPDGRVKALVQGVARVRVEAFLEQNLSTWVRVSLFEHVEPEWSVESEALIRTVRGRVEELLPLKNLPPEIVSVTASVNEPGQFADMVAAHLKLRLSDAQEVLEIQDSLARLRKVDAFLRRELDVTSVQAEIQSQAQDEMSRSQREHFLREQLRAIQAELGDVEESPDEVEAYRTRFAGAGLPEESLAEALKQVSRLERMHPESPEAQVARSYLDWMIDLPWSHTSTDRLDLAEARAILDEDHAHLNDIKERILDFLGVRKLRGDSRGPVLCFSGPPGVGKTSLAKSIARAMGREFVRISLGGVRDEAEIRGHRRTYVGALPGRILQGLRDAGTRNPVFLLDEVDKLGADYRGDPTSSLLEVLDPEQNDRFSDHYLNVPFDLSKVLFIATANLLENIPAPLRDRMEVIRLSGYTPEEKEKIARLHLIPAQVEEHGLAESQLSWSGPAIRELVRGYTHEAGVRDLDRQIATVCRKAARRVAEGEVERLAVDRRKLLRLLGAPPHHPEQVDTRGAVGVAHGLAWTEAGGEVLQLEASLTRGRGLQLTGQLGDVMKESAAAALTWTRSHAEALGFDESVLRHHEIHLHVPAGAIPKDGPSAGIAIAAVLTSLATGRKTRADVAMTGELTLRGRVLPVGGVREKALAALRAGISRVVIPRRNVQDLEEIPRELKRRIEFIPVDHMEEVLEAVFDKPLVARRRSARAARRRSSPPAAAASAKSS